MKRDDIHLRGGDSGEVGSESLVDGEHGELVNAENSGHVGVQVDVSLVGRVLEVVALDVSPHLRDDLD
jgi:hypothetical protein